MAAQQQLRTIYTWGGGGHMYQGCTVHTRRASPAESMHLDVTDAIGVYDCVHAMRVWVWSIQRVRADVLESTRNKGTNGSICVRVRGG